MRSLSYIFVFIDPIFVLDFSSFLDTRSIKGDFLFFRRLLVFPKCIIGRSQALSGDESPYDDFLEIEVRGIVISGSVNIIAVASTVLGIKNPDVGRSEEYTLNTTAPSSPADSKVTSAATIGT